MRFSFALDLFNGLEAANLTDSEKKSSFPRLNSRNSLNLTVLTSFFSRLRWRYAGTPEQ
jgi:hypothetical protein